MRRKIMMIGGAMLLGASTFGLAQPHAGGVLIGGGYPSNSTSYLNGLYSVDRATGKMTTVVDTFTARRPYYFNQTQMDVDNRTIALVTSGTNNTLYNLTYGLFRYNPATMRFSTIARSTMDFEDLSGLSIGQDGGYYITGYGRDTSNSIHYRVYRVAPSGQWTTVLSTLQLGYRQVFSSASIRDVDTGDLLIPADVSVGFFARPVYSLSHDGTIGTWNTSSGGPNPPYGMAQEIATGDLLHISGRTLYRTQKGRTATSSGSITSLVNSAYGVVFENQSVANPQLIAHSVVVGSSKTTATLEFIDPTTRTVTKTVTFVNTNTRTLSPYPSRPALNGNARYIQTVRTGSRTWDLKLSAPAYPNKPYVVAAGFSGVRPGVPFVGRHIWLNLDPLVPLTVDNKIPSVFDPGPLMLDGNGNATGKINTGFLPPAITLGLHIVLLVIDPAAPQGVAFITEPFPVTV